MSGIRKNGIVGIALGVIQALVVATMLVVATPAAQAATPDAPSGPNTAPTRISTPDSGTVTPMAKADCPAGAFCVWVNSNYSDGPARFFGNNADWRDFPHASCPSGTWNNCASSGFNNGTTGMGVGVWALVNYGGYSACLPRGWSYSNFADLVWPGTNSSFNDTISGNYWVTSC